MKVNYLILIFATIHICSCNKKNPAVVLSGDESLKFKQVRVNTRILFEEYKGIGDFIINNQLKSNFPLPRTRKTGVLPGGFNIMDSESNPHILDHVVLLVIPTMIDQREKYIVGTFSKLDFTMIDTICFDRNNTKISTFSNLYHPGQESFIQMKTSESRTNGEYVNYYVHEYRIFQDGRIVEESVKRSTGREFNEQAMIGIHTGTYSNDEANITMTVKDSRVNGNYAVRINARGKMCQIMMSNLDMPIINGVMIVDSVADMRILIQEQGLKLTIGKLEGGCIKTLESEYTMLKN